MKNGSNGTIPSERAISILVVDPDPAIRKEVRTACEQDGYEVLDADSGIAGVREFEKAHASLVILELSLPDMSGFDVCRDLRRIDSGASLLVISNRSDEIDVVVALEIGADDYMVKPLRLREMMARIAVHLRRSRHGVPEHVQGRLEFKDLVIDVNERRVFKDAAPVDLTHTEFDLLTFLAQNAGKVLSREKILNMVWNYDYPIETRVIDVHIRNLRRKIESQSNRPYYILAVPGIGYRFTNARPEM